MARNPKFQECGSTACIAYVRVLPQGGRELYVANVGDAQAVLGQEVTGPSPPSTPQQPTLTQQMQLGQTLEYAWSCTLCVVVWMQAWVAASGRSADRANGLLRDHPAALAS